MIGGYQESMRMRIEILSKIRSIAFLAVIALAATALTGCVTATASVETRVDGNGFTATVKGASIHGPTNVAVPGTKVTVTTITAPVPAAVSQFTKPVGTAVAVSLNGNQPAKPLTAVFDVSAGVDPASVFVLGEDSTSRSGVAFVDSTYDTSSHQVTAALMHLSWYEPVVVDRGQLGNQLGKWIGQSAGIRTEPPGCYGGSSSDLNITGLTQNVVWPCATATSSGTDWSMQSNDGLVWQVFTDPDTTYNPITASSLSNAATAALFNIVKPALKGKSVLLPGETLSGHFTSAPTYTVALKVEPGLSQVASILFGLGMIFPSKWLELTARGECLIGVVNSGTSTLSGGTLRSVLSCVATLLKGSGAAILGILLTGPALLVNQLEGAAREIARTNAVQFTITAKDPNRVDILPSGSAWLYSLPQDAHQDTSGEQETAQVPTGDSVAEYPNSTNQWVGCDGSIAEVGYTLGGKYNTAKLTFAVQAHAPAGMNVEYEVLTDYDAHGTYGNSQDTVGSYTVTRGGEMTTAHLDVTNVQHLYVIASTAAVCGGASIGYGSLVQSYVQ